MIFLELIFLKLFHENYEITAGLGRLPCGNVADVSLVTISSSCRKLLLQFSLICFLSTWTMTMHFLCFMEGFFFYWRFIKWISIKKLRKRKKYIYKYFSRSNNNLFFHILLQILFIFISLKIFLWKSFPFENKKKQ